MHIIYSFRFILYAEYSICAQIAIIITSIILNDIPLSGHWKIKPISDTKAANRTIHVTTMRQLLEK